MNQSYLPILLLALSSILILGRQFYFSRIQKHGPFPLWVDVAIIVSILVAAALLELSMGRTPWYAHGGIRIWSGTIASDQNSQQIADPYTFTHITHGILLYGLLELTLRRASLRLKGILGVSLESAWEVFENTDFVIQRYRAATISLNYYGDSVINSVCDILACILGFFLAAKLPPRVTILSVILLELILALWIRDSLVLNMIMLIYPIKVIRVWQMGGY